MIRNRFLTLIFACAITLSSIPALALTMATPRPLIRTTTPAPKKAAPSAKPTSRKTTARRTVRKVLPQKSIKPARKVVAAKVPTKRLVTKKQPAAPKLRGVEPTTLRSGPVALPKPRSTLDRALRTRTTR
jgi:hypothetical protein